MSALLIARIRELSLRRLSRITNRHAVLRLGEIVTWVAVKA